MKLTTLFHGTGFVLIGEVSLTKYINTGVGSNGFTLGNGFYLTNHLSAAILFSHISLQNKLHRDKNIISAEDRIQQVNNAGNGNIYAVQINDDAKILDATQPLNPAAVRKILIEGGMNPDKLKYYSDNQCSKLSAASTLLSQLLDNTTNPIQELVTRLGYDGMAINEPRWQSWDYYPTKLTVNAKDFLKTPLTFVVYNEKAIKAYSLEIALIKEKQVLSLMETELVSYLKTQTEPQENDQREYEIPVQQCAENINQFFGHYASAGEVGFYIKKQLDLFGHRLSLSNQHQYSPLTDRSELNEKINQAGTQISLYSNKYEAYRANIIFKQREKITVNQSFSALTKGQLYDHEIDQKQFNAMKLLYGNEGDKIKALRKKGNIITFKEPFFWKGESFTQILITAFTKDSRGNLKLEASNRDSNWYPNINALVDAVDWDWMEKVHGHYYKIEQHIKVGQQFKIEKDQNGYEISKIGKQDQGRVYYANSHNPEEKYSMAKDLFIQKFSNKEIAFLKKPIAKITALNQVSPDPLISSTDNSFTGSLTQHLESSSKNAFRKSLKEQVAKKENLFDATHTVQATISSSINPTTMSVQITPDQQAKADKLLSNLDYLGFKRAFHEANVIKAITDGKESFTLKDASYSKQVNFEVVVSTNSKGNFKHEIRAEHSENGNKVIMPYKNAFLSKSGMEGLLNGGWPLLRNHNVYGKEKVEIEGKMVNPLLRTDSSFISMRDKPAKTWEEAAALGQHLKSHNIKFFVLQEHYFGHQFSNQDKAQLFNGHKMDANTINLETGEKQITKGLRINFPVDTQGKSHPKLSYDQIDSTGEFITQDELLDVKAAMKKKVAVTTDEPATEDVSQDQKQEQKKEQKKKKSTRKAIA